MSNTHSTLLGRAIQQFNEFKDYIKAYIQEEVANACPVGTVRMWSGRDLPSSKWVWIRGQTLQKASYPKLFQVWGVGSSTYTLPNTVNRFPEGGDPGSFGQTINAGLPNITGTTQTLDDTSAVGGAFRVDREFGFTQQALLYIGITPDYQVSFDASRSSAIYGRSPTVQPDAFRVAYILKVL